MKTFLSIRLVLIPLSMRCTRWTHTHSLSLVITAYFDYVLLLRIRHFSFKLYDSYGDRFCSPRNKLITNGFSVSIIFTLAAWSLIHRANIDPFQYLGVIFAAVSSVGFSKLTPSSGKEVFLSAMWHFTIEAVVFQCCKTASVTSERFFDRILPTTELWPCL